MFDITELKQLYDAQHFTVSQNQYTWTEKQKNEKALASVSLQYGGGRISVISSSLLQQTQDAYHDDKNNTLSLRKICDAILLLDRDDQHYIIILEVKSGFNDIKKKAIRQIPASYIKLHSLLNDFSTFNKADYRTFGLVISYPYKQLPATSAERNPEVMAHKRIIAGNKAEQVTQRYANQLRDKGKTTLQAADFELGRLSAVKPALLFQGLEVLHCPVPDKQNSATVDLDAVIRQL